MSLVQKTSNFSLGKEGAFVYITSELILSLNPINRLWKCSSLDKAIANLLQWELTVAKTRMWVIRINQQLPAISLLIRDMRQSITIKHHLLLRLSPNRTDALTNCLLEHIEHYRAPLMGRSVWLCNTHQFASSEEYSKHYLFRCATW